MIILPDLQPSDFKVKKNIVVDVENKGFTSQELQQLAGPAPAQEGERGFTDWWNSLWAKNREVPDNIKDLKSQFNYQEQPVLIDLIETAKNQNVDLDGQIETLSSKYNFYLMRCGVFIEPKEDEKFEALKFEVSYKTKKVSTYSMLPVPATKDILKIGVQSEIGITGGAEFGLPQLPPGIAKLEASAKAKVEANIIYSFHYELKTQIVAKLR